MKLDDNLEEIFALAYAADPIRTEYHLTKVLIKMPSEVETYPGCRGLNEYEIDEPATYGDNLEKKKLENLISKLRHSRI